MPCLFCNEPDKSYKPEPDKDFICGSCVQLLLRADQNDLSRAHKKALDKGYINKAKAIESFLHDGGNYEQRKPKSKKRGRHPNRTRIDRVTGNKKERIKRSAVSTPITVL
jgi:hypothetical protein